MAVRWIVYICRIHVWRAKLFGGPWNSLNFLVGFKVLVVIGNGLKIGVKNIHILGIDNLALMHADHRLITSNPYKHGSLIESQSNNISIFSRNRTSPSHPQIIFQRIQKRIISRVMDGANTILGTGYQQGEFRVETYWCDGEFGELEGVQVLARLVIPDLYGMIVTATH